MEVQIVDNQAKTVCVHTTIGCFNGIWCSQTPVISKRYIVEMDSDEVLTLDDVEFSKSCEPCIEQAGKIINITGFVEEIQDEVMVLRVQKSLMMIGIISDFDFWQYNGHYVCVKLREIRLYDTGIY